MSGINADLDREIALKLRALGLMAKDEWMTAQEAAHHLKVSKSHFLRVANSGGGPVSCGLGRMRRWRTSALDAWQLARDAAH